MEQSSDKRGPQLEDEMKKETEELERSGKEAHVEENREQEGDEDDRLAGGGHRVSGTGSSADTYPHTDRGEEGGASHPKPKDG